MVKLKYFLVWPVVALFLSTTLSVQALDLSEGVKALEKAKETAKGLGTEIKDGAVKAKDSLGKINSLDSFKTEGKKTLEDLKGLKTGLDSAKKVYEELKGKLYSSDVKERLSALKDLEFKDGAQAVTLLKDFMNKSKGDEKGHALSLLLKKKVPGLIPQMAKLWEKVGSETRMRMAYNSRYVKDPTLLKELMNVFKNDKDELVREYALNSLSKMKGKLNIEDLKKNLSDESLSTHLKSALGKLIVAQESVQAPKPPVVPTTPTPLLPTVPNPNVNVPKAPSVEVPTPVVPIPPKP